MARDADLLHYTAEGGSIRRLLCGLAFQLSEHLVQEPEGFRGVQVVRERVVECRGERLDFLYEIGGGRMRAGYVCASAQRLPGARHGGPYPPKGVATLLKNILRKV